MSWMEGGILQTAAFVPHPDDFSSDVTERHGNRVVFRTSDRSPTFQDFDGDGRMDVGLFDRIGMVNGSYTMLRRTDACFEVWGVLDGDTFLLDESGLITANGRSSCCARGVAFHDPTRPGLPVLFTLAVRAEEFDDGAPQCQMQTDGDAAALRRRYVDVIDAYCDLYREDRAHDTRMIRDLWATTASLVDDTTVFTCTLDNGRSLRLSRGADTLTYGYGPADRFPDLTFDTALDGAAILRDDGAGPSRFSRVELPRDGHAYQIEHGYTQSGDGTPSGPYGRLTVTDPGGAVVFNRPCDLDTLYSVIHRLPAR